MTKMKHWKYDNVTAAGPARHLVIIDHVRELVLHCDELPGGRQWYLARHMYHGSEDRTPLPDLGDKDTVQRQVPEGLSHNSNVADVLLALPSIANRPSDYGLNRQELDTLVETGDFEGVVLRIPTMRRIGKVKVQINGQAKLQDALEKFRAWPAGQQIVLALATGRGSGRAVSAWLPEALLAEVERDARRLMISPSECVQRAVQEKYQIR